MADTEKTEGFPNDDIKPWIASIAVGIIIMEIGVIFYLWFFPSDAVQLAMSLIILVGSPLASIPKFSDNIPIRADIILEILAGIYATGVLTAPWTEWLEKIPIWLLILAGSIIAFHLLLKRREGSFSYILLFRLLDFK